MSFFCFIMQMGKSPLHSHMFTFSTLLLVKMLSELCNKSYRVGVQGCYAETSPHHSGAAGLPPRGLPRRSTPWGAATFQGHFGWDTQPGRSPTAAATRVAELCLGCTLSTQLSTPATPASPDRDQMALLPKPAPNPFPPCQQM